MDSGKARSHRDGGGLPVFHRKTGFFEYLQRKYSNSPRPSGTPLINAGGKKTSLPESLFLLLFRGSQGILEQTSNGGASWTSVL